MQQLGRASPVESGNSVRSSTGSAVDEPSTTVPQEKDGSPPQPKHFALASAASFRSAAVGPRGSRLSFAPRLSVRAESQGVLDSIESKELDDFFSSQCD